MNIYNNMLIVGLGNPGEKYVGTRHNVGFLVLEKLRANLDLPEFKSEKKFNAEVSVGNANLRSIENQKIILTKPQTFMNLSGQAVSSILNFYKLTPDDLLVIHDDIDIVLGEYRIATDSSSAGHNGVQNIIENLGTQKFRRIRIGVGNENLRSQVDPENFVLQKFAPDEMEQFNTVLKKVLEEI